MKKQSTIIALLCLAFVMAEVLGCSTKGANAKWPVFYDSEKGPEHLFIARDPESLASLTNEFPAWNYDLRIPLAKISAATTRNLAEVNGLRVIEVRLSLSDTYYTDALMILQEVKNGQFLPVYVQDFNQHTRMPSPTMVRKENSRIIVETGMDYSGSGCLHNHYKITLATNHKPSVTGSFY